jgi:hypothetical protein
LFCSYEVHQNWDASDLVLGVFGKLWMRMGAWMGFGSMMFGLEVQKFLNY